MRLSVLGTVIASFVLLATAEARTPENVLEIYRENPKLLQDSIRHSNELRREWPGVDVILNRVGADHLHDLDPDKSYRLNLKTGEVTATDRNEIPKNQIQDLDIPFPFPDGYGFERAGIRLVEPDILGKAQTYVYCPLRFHTAEVSGYLASNISRDPVVGNKQGEIFDDNYIHTQAELNLRILAASGGAENVQNRSVMETAHYSVCEDEVKLNNHIVTWPD